jgi:hypothetical protein
MTHRSGPRGRGGPVHLAEDDSAARPGRDPGQVLIGLSHAVERFALAADPRHPLVVIALFQRSSYFEREVAVYRDIGARGAVTIVGLVEDFPLRTPPGCTTSRSRRTAPRPGSGA